MRNLFDWTLRINSLIISSVTSKSAMTPSLRGRMVCISEFSLPTISLASVPTAMIFLVMMFLVTMVGSLRTMPSPLTYMRVFAVPRSMPMSLEKNRDRKVIQHSSLDTRRCRRLARSLVLGVAPKVATFGPHLLAPGKITIPRRNRQRLGFAVLGVGAIFSWQTTGRVLSAEIARPTPIEFLALRRIRGPKLLRRQLEA